MKRSKYKVLVDGEGSTANNKERFKFACCDCGLIHEVAIVAPKLGPAARPSSAMVRRHRRATAQRRRWMKHNDQIQRVASTKL